MAATCSISGDTTDNAVVITKTGYVFDKTLLDKFAEQNGFVCPVSGETYDPKENVVALKSSRTKTRSHAPKPRTTQAASIPGLLGLLQNEWDAVMLEVHKLR